MVNETEVVETVVEEKISAEELENLGKIKTVGHSKAMEAKNLELEFKNAVLMLFVKYHLDGEDSFDESTGVITRAKKV